MEDSSTWIKLHRKILDWEWYDDINVKVLFLHLLLTVNYKDKRWRGVEVKRGSIITSIAHLSLATGLSSQQVRTAIKKLKINNEITSLSQANYTVITVLKYDEYQGSNKSITNEQQTNNKPITNQQQTNNKRLTTTKERKKVIKKERKKDIKKEIIHTHIASDGELDLIVSKYNQVFHKDITSTRGFEDNFKYWRKVYELKDIEQAIEKASMDNYWKDKLTLTILFRKKNTNGEAVDYIQDLKERKVQSGNIYFVS